MIVDLPGTTTTKISKELVKLREEGGAVALGRVLTLVIVTIDGEEESAIEAANDASREHPMRVIVLCRPLDSGDRPNRLDGQIRVGGDAGASEVVVLHAEGELAADDEGLVTGLLLPDAPVVVWWPSNPPERPSASPLGRIAQRRITDAAAAPDHMAAIEALAGSYVPGDTDFAWTRLTNWRQLLAAVLDQPPYDPVTAVRVAGASDSPSTRLLAAWLALELDVDVQEEILTDATGGLRGVWLDRPSGQIALERPVQKIATLTQPGQPTHDISLPRRSLRECLAEELRRLDPDDLFGEVVSAGLARLGGH